MLSTNGGTQLTNGWYWSSTYNYGGGNLYYIVTMSNGNVNYDYIYGNYYVRPVMKF